MNDKIEVRLNGLNILINEQIKQITELREELIKITDTIMPEIERIKNDLRDIHIIQSSLETRYMVLLNKVEGKYRWQIEQ